MFNWRLVFKTMGVLTTLEALFMLVPTFAAFWYDEPDLGAWVVSSAITWLSSWWMLLAGRNAERRVGEREGYVIVATVWVVYSLFGMLPFWLSGALPELTNAWFETMAGFTTTGATVIRDVTAMTHSILLWRSLMQWLGGMGIIVLSVAILPMFGLGGMQLYSAEVTGVSYEKLSPRIADTAKHMWLTYIVLTITQTALLNLEGMTLFDSICHSLSTISTGGFSTRNDSMISDNAAIQWTTAIFMFLSGINFTQLLRHRARCKQDRGDGEFLRYGRARAAKRFLHGLLGDDQYRLCGERLYDLAETAVGVCLLPDVYRRFFGFNRRRYEMGTSGHLCEIGSSRDQASYPPQRRHPRAF